MPFMEMLDSSALPVQLISGSPNGVTGAEGAEVAPSI